MHIQLPEGEPLGSKLVEGIVKIKILVSRKCVSLVYIIQLYYIAQCKKLKKRNSIVYFNV